MVLLHALQKVHSKIVVAHVNYKLRGADSDRDADLVKEISKENKLPFQCLEYDLRADLDQHGGNLQEKARDIRYLFFQKLLNTHDSAYLVLAHHQGDQIENFWMQMARSGGIRAMSGMSMKNSRTLRPLLSIPKEQLHHYAIENNIQWRFDTSNQKNEYTRNIWRNILIPKLKESIPHIDESVMRLQEVFREQIREDEKHTLSLIKSKNKSILLKYTVMNTFNSNQWIEWLYQLDIPRSLSESIVVLPFATNGKKVLIESKRSPYKAVWREEKGLYFQAKEEPHIKTPQFTLSDALSIPKSFTKDILYLNPEFVKGQINIRKWQQGDRICPIGVKGSKLVSDILKDAKTPLRLREDHFVLVDEEKPLALIGFCIDSRSIAHNTPCLKIEIIRLM
jgi:tRNA(Ile)-lysidine synthase